MTACLFKSEVKEEEQRTRNLVWPWLIWRIWKARNAICFTNQQEDANQILNKAFEDSREWMEANKKVARNSNPIPKPTIKWEPPPRGKYKCNVDAAWKKDAETCGAGWLVRDDEGRVKWVGFKTYPSLLSSLESKAAALSWAMRCIDNLRFGEVIFETDSQQLVTTISDPSKWPRLSSFTADILRHRRKILKPLFRFQRRKGNGCMDLIASKVSSQYIYSAFLDCSTPEWLKPLVEQEKCLCFESI